MNDKEIVEREVLKIIRNGKGQYGWYVIAQTLANRDVPRIPGLRETLVELEKRDLIWRRPGEDPSRDGWDLTEKGRLFLEQLDM